MSDVTNDIKAPGLAGGSAPAPARPRAPGTKPGPPGTPGTPGVRTGRLPLHLEWGALLLISLWVVWLGALALPLADLFGTSGASVSVGRRVLILAAVAVFVGVYGWTAWHNALRSVVSDRLQSPRSLVRWSPVRWIPARWWLIVVLTILSLIISLTAGPDWLMLFIFTSASAAGYLPVRPAATAIGSLVVLTLATGLLAGAQAGLLWENTIRVATVGISVASLTQAILLGRALQEARAEIARLAVTQERLRFARDLHDLLGHSLSLITLKSELAVRLVEKSPQLARAEIRDVVGVARTALREVREAVAGYRQPTLADELQGAAEMLAAAGIAFGQPGSFGYSEYSGKAGGPVGAAGMRDGDEAEATSLCALPAPIEAVLAWAVREGVTNVIRHSRARHCAIQLRQDANSVTLEVIDDGASTTHPSQVAVSVPPAPDRQAGQGRNAGNTSKVGSGLVGLRERVEALGGSCEAGRMGAGAGGFRLLVTLPLRESVRIDYVAGNGLSDAQHPGEQMAVENIENIENIENLGKAERTSR